MKTHKDFGTERWRENIGGFNGWRRSDVCVQ